MSGCIRWRNAVIPEVVEEAREVEEILIDCAVNLGVLEVDVEKALDTREGNQSIYVSGKVYVVIKYF